MRTVLTVLAFALLPGAAAAECGCTCDEGRSVPVCSLPTDTPPICQILCIDSLSQAITQRSIDSPVSSGGGFVSAPSGGSSSRGSVGTSSGLSTAGVSSAASSVARAFGAGADASSTAPISTTLPRNALPSPTMPSLAYPSGTGASPYGR